jgi:hypothetical protein
MANAAMFTGLVFDEAGNPAEVAWVGDTACYVVLDEDFRRHIDAEKVDRNVLRILRTQIEEQRELAVKTMLDMMGKDDIFTKAALESTISKLEETVGQPIPEEARQYLGMLGFRIVIDFHGEIVELDMPAGAIDEGE